MGIPASKHNTSVQLLFFGTLKYNSPACNSDSKQFSFKEFILEAPATGQSPLLHYKSRLPRLTEVTCLSLLPSSHLGGISLLMAGLMWAARMGADKKIEVPGFCWLWNAVNSYWDTNRFWNDVVGQSKLVIILASICPGWRKVFKSSIMLCWPKWAHTSTVAITLNLRMVCGNYYKVCTLVITDLGDSDC